jgi:pimeloyl-ACP methyl ester carboxylesterase
MHRTFATASGQRLAYRRVGSGPILVCHPGGPGFSSEYLGSLGGLGALFDLVLLDPRGTGGSDAPADPTRYRLLDYVEDLDALREHLGLEGVDLFGHSAGGWVAVHYAVAHPDRVSRLILCEMSLRPVEPPPRERYFARSGPDELGLLERLGQPNAAAHALFREEIRPTLDMRPLLPFVAAPTLVLSGSESLIVPAETGETAAALLADGRAVIVPGAGHFPSFEAPAEFAAAVREFLGGSARTARAR